MQAQGLSDSSDQGKSRSDFFLLPPPVFKNKALPAQVGGALFLNTCMQTKELNPRPVRTRGERGIRVAQRRARERPCACRRKGSPIRLTKENRAAIFCLPPQTYSKKPPLAVFFRPR
jgi:hypothetical protein